jgi:hypothetical protein
MINYSCLTCILMLQVWRLRYFIADKCGVPFSGDKPRHRSVKYQLVSIYFVYITTPSVAHTIQSRMVRLMNGELEWILKWSWHISAYHPSIRLEGIRKPWDRRVSEPAEIRTHTFPNKEKSFAAWYNLFGLKRNVSKIFSASIIRV